MIDLRHIEDLRQDIGAEDFAEVVALTLEEIEEALEHLLAPGPAAEVAELCHGLKGLALNVGLEDLSRAADEGERHPEALDREALRATFDVSRAALRGML